VRVAGDGLRPGRLGFGDALPGAAELADGSPVRAGRVAADPLGGGAEAAQAARAAPAATAQAARSQARGARTEGIPFGRQDQVTCHTNLRIS